MMMNRQQQAETWIRSGIQTVPDLAQALKLSNQTVSSILYDLKKKGIVEKLGHNKWGLKAKKKPPAPVSLPEPKVGPVHFFKPFKKEETTPAQKIMKIAADAFVKGYDDIAINLRDAAKMLEGT